MSFKLLTSAFKTMNKISPAKWKGFAQGMVETQRTASSDAISRISGNFSNLFISLNPLQALLEPLSEIFSIWGDIISSSFTPIIQALFDILLSPSVMDLLGTITDLFSGLFAALEPIIAIAGVLITIFVEIVNTALQPLFTIVEALIPVFELIADLIGAILIPVLNILGPIFGTIADILAEILVPIIEGFTPILEALAPLFEAIGKVMEALLIPIVEAFLPIFQSLMPLFELFSGILEPLIPIIEALVPVFELIADVLATYVNPALEFLIGLFNNVVTFIINVIQGAVEGFFMVVQGIANFFIDIINFVISTINNVISLVTLGLGPQIPLIPKLAEGALVTKPTLALIGERGPEIVAPVEKVLDQNDNTNLEFQLRELNSNILTLIEKVSQRGDTF